MGRHDLGLPEADFWRLTPALFAILLSRRAAAEERGDFRAALICTVLANIHRGKRRPFKPADFMPQHEREVDLYRETSPEEALAKARALTAALGGVDLTRGTR